MTTAEAETTTAEITPAEAMTAVVTAAEAVIPAETAAEAVIPVETAAEQDRPERTPEKAAPMIRRSLAEQILQPMQARPLTRP